MQLSKACVFLVFVSIFLSTKVYAQNTWIVDRSGNGDYKNIQVALDNSQDGDLLRVKEGEYKPFILSKGVMVSSYNDTPFTVVTERNVGKERIQILDVPEGVQAGIRGMIYKTITEDPYNTGPFELSIEVRDCLGEIVLESIDFDDTGEIDYGVPNLKISNSPNVAVSHFTIIHPIRNPGDRSTETDTITIDNSKVRFSDIHVEAYWGSNGYCGHEYCGHYGEINGEDGDHGMLIENQSYVEISNSTIKGGHGGNGVYDWQYYGLGQSGDGGDAIRLFQSELVVLGTEQNLFQGGDGGEEGNCLGWGGATEAGFGGAGIRGDEESVILVSRVQLQGGAAGGLDFGQWCESREGPDFIGNVTRMDTLAALSMSKNISLGGQAELIVDSVEAGGVLFIGSDAGGFLEIGGFLGPTLSALPGSFFILFPGGATDVEGKLSFPFTFYSDPVLIGTILSVQAAVFADSGANYLTNSVTRTVLGEL